MNGKLISHIVKGVCAVIALLYFCPLFAVSCSGTSLVNFNGVDATFGKTVTSYSSERIKGSPLAALLFIIPVLIIVILLVRKTAPILTVALSAAGVIVLIACAIKATGRLDSLGLKDYGAKISFSFTYIIQYVLYIGVAVLSLFGMTLERGGAQAFTQTGAAYAPRAVPPPPEARQTKFCPQCGASLSAEAQFCAKCGASL